ncbi:MAG: hypothetical protein Q4D14_04415 [Bacteroidales bacterium]|nr:hypothetical protein [Bacteroidales bacterium]
MRKQVFITLILLCFCIMQLHAVDVIFRYDDFRFRHNPTDSALLTLFAKHHIPITIAVIPFDSLGHPIVSDTNSIVYVNKCQIGGGWKSHFMASVINAAPMVVS